jgi:hypothetical protein
VYGRCVFNEAKEKAMKRITTTVMGLAALVAMLVLGVSAGSAQAHSFLWSGAVPSLVLAVNENTQIFQAEAGGAEVKCKKARFHGTITTAKSLTQVLTGLYSECVGPLSAPATVSGVEYEFNADETVSVINKAIAISIPLAGCEILVGPQKNLSAVKYLLDPNSRDLALLVDANVGSISNTIKGGGGACGAEGHHTNGTDIGLALEFVDPMGTLIWH